MRNITDFATKEEFLPRSEMSDPEGACPKIFDKVRKEHSLDDNIEMPVEVSMDPLL